MQPAAPSSDKASMGFGTVVGKSLVGMVRLNGLLMGAYALTKVGEMGYRACQAIAPQWPWLNKTTSTLKQYGFDFREAANKTNLRLLQEATVLGIGSNVINELCRYGEGETPRIYNMVATLLPIRVDERGVKKRCKQTWEYDLGNPFLPSNLTVQLKAKEG